MNPRPLLALIFSVLAINAAAQPLIPFQFTSDDENRLIKENDSFKFYVASRDTTNIVAINEEASLYRLYNHEQKLIAEGNFIVEGDKYLQDGKWTELYANGKTKRTGYFRHNAPIGTWEEYYSSGRIKMVSNYGIFDERNQITSCLSGTYLEYYQSGKLKVSGFYSAGFTTVNDTVVVNDPVSGQDIEKIIQHKQLTAGKMGHWEYYDENGELEKAEDL